MVEQECARARQNAKAWLESINEMVGALEVFTEDVTCEQCGADNDEDHAEDCAESGPVRRATIDGEIFEDEDAVRERITESILSIQVRYPWITPGCEADMLKDGPEEFEILLTTGGPALRIVGNLDNYREPERARLQYQDWGTPWTEYIVTGSDHDALMTFCRQFYFGEG